MKKFFAYALLSGAVMTMATSCSQEDIVMPGDGGGNVTFQVSLPQDMGTRALGDGLSATNLKYAVYDSKDNLVTEGSASFGSGSLTTTVSLELATGVSYKVAFFAYKQYGSGIYSFSAADKSVAVDYEAMSGNMRWADLDCFYTLQPVDVTDNMQPVSTVLYRPVAQVNWGTSDLASPAVTNAYRRVQTKLEATACTKFDLISGEATDPQDISITSLERQSKLNYDFPVEGYEYLNVMYLFAPKSDAALMDLTLQVYNNTTPITSISVPNAPVERNFRTNIYGALLTNKFDITVEKSADWGGSNNLWQGDVQQPTVDAEGNYSVANAAQLAGLAQLINGGNSLEGKTVTLTSDIDLNNRNWTPMGTVANPFKGTFDGNGKTINNLNVTLGNTSVPAGLFGMVNGSGKVTNLTVNNATINTLAATPANYGTGVIAGNAIPSVVFENITVNNADIKAYRWSGGIAGYTYASLVNNTVDGINIELSYEKLANGKYDNCDKAGAIVGLHGGEGAYKITGNKASNVTISGYRDIGGLFGRLNANESANCVYSDNTVTGGTITQNWAHPYDDTIKPGDYIGEIVGNLKADWHPSNNTASGVTLVIPEIATDAASFIADVKAGKNVVVNTDLNLNLTADLTVGDNATITVAEGKTLSLGSARLDVVGKAAFIGSGKITGSYAYYSLISNTPGSHIVIDGVTIENTANSNVGGTVNTVADITVKSGVIKSNNGSALVGNWTNGNSGVMNIEGGTFYNTGYGAYAVTVAGKGTATINGGEFFGNFGCFRTNSSGPGNIKATINGGLFVCYGKGGAEGNYYAVAVDPGIYDTGGAVTINGGEFWSTNTTLYARNTSTLTINGGMFKALNNYPVASGHSAQNISVVKTVFNPATASDLEIAFGVNVK